ncbi:MAG: hypothetical protein QXP77_00130 [Candidatus Aenigmatarchaeota archaeon]
MNVHKGVAIPYIVALVIGLIVIVFIVYLVYKTSTSSSLNLQECKSRYTTWCTNCAQMNWPPFHCMPMGVWECRQILQSAGFIVPSGTCQHTEGGVGVAICNYTDVKKDCAGLGVCLNNNQC